MVLDFDIALTQGSFSLEAACASTSRSLALFGPSGSGKTTLVEAIAGLRRPDRGHVRVGGRKLFSSTEGVDVPVHRRHVGYVPQDLALFPHMSVRRNVMYGAGRGAVSNFERVTSVLEIGPLLPRAVRDLSGGERQRVALARALMSSPDLLLMDEPLASVDAPLRRRIVPYLQRVRDDLKVPVVYVSHDEEEVRAIGEWILTLAQGRVIRSVGVGGF
ncbi:MAG: ATP-binding cassette domain-containing protein [Acidobacteria bacterium]|nr:ATP-binding cassette domain-containing protein [Acidobacteriota bacterium]